MFKKKTKETGVEGATTEIQRKKKKKMSGKKKGLIFGCILVVAAGGVFIASKSIASKPILTPVTTGTVLQADIEEAVSIKGTIQGSESADVTSSLNYKITSILVKEGDVVKKDQTIAILDSDELQDDYKKSETALSQAQFDYDAAKLLYDEGAISEEAYVKAKTAYENAQITLSSYRIAEKVNIKSPISGTVTRVNVTLGRYAKDTEDNLPMFVIEDLANLEMKVKISEYDIARIKVGQPVSITADVLGKDTVGGTVARISPSGEPKETGSKEMVVPVQIKVNKGNSGLMAGVTAKARIQIKSKENALTVPIDALLEDPSTGENFVFRVKENKLEKISVALGIEGDFHTEIISDVLASGDQVVLAPGFDLEDGTEVTVTNGTDGTDNGTEEADDAADGSDAATM